jgi:ATP-binding cassette subfamily C protein CydC
MALTLHRLLRTLKPFAGLLAASTLFRLINQALGIALIVTAVWGLVAVAKFPGQVSVWNFALVLTGLGMLKGIFRYLEQYSGHYVAFRLLLVLRHRLFEKLEALAPAGLAGARSGDFVSRAVSDIERVEVFYAHTIAPVIIAAILPAATLAVLWQFSSTMALAMIPFIVLTGAIVPWLTFRLTKTAAGDVRKGIAALTASFADNLQGVRETLIFGCERLKADEIRGVGSALAGAQKSLARSGASQIGLSDFIIGSGTLAAILIGASQVHSGLLVAWDFPIALALAICAFLPLLGITNLIPDLDQALTSADRLFEILERPEPAVWQGEQIKPQSPAPSQFAFESVSFHYPGTSENVLYNLSFRIQPGQITALVGASGAGKSSIVNLLLGFWKPTSGAIQVAGTDARNYLPEALRDYFAVAPQRIHLFNQSLRENLLLGKPDATQGEIEKAASLAGIHGFITSLPSGYDTKAFEAGQRLSGGQRQRIALARAFLKDAPILVLDEATSNLDAETEAEILENLHLWIAEAPEGKTRAVLLITHRLSGARMADHIVVLHRGQVEEEGTHEDLLVAEGEYSALFRYGTPAVGDLSQPTTIG